MRLFIAVFLVVSTFPARAHAADEITPGMKYADARQTLDKHGFEVNSEKFGLAIAAPNELEVLEFCRIDDEVTLALAYDRKSGHIASLTLYFIGDGPKSTRSFVAREILKLSLTDDSFTIKLRRKRPNKS